MENTLENIGLKNVSIDFLNSEIKNLFVVQGDTRTRGLLVRVKDNKGNTIPLSDEYELRLYAKRSGEDKLLYSVAEKIGDRYKVYLTSDMLAEIEERYNQINTSFDGELKLKADKKHTHAINDVDGLRNTLDNHERIFNSNIGSISNLSDKLQYKASTDSVAELEKKVNGKADKTDLSKKSDVGHTHSISDVSNLQTTLNGKASKSHTHSISDVSNLQSTLNSKASTSHSHSISDINNLQYTLNNKASASDLSSLEAKINNLSNDSVRNKNGGSLSFWAGTQYQYDNIYYKDSDTIYFITE